MTLGFVRLALVLLAIFVLASVPALIVAGRWIRGFGREGLPVDEQQVEGTVRDFRIEFERMKRERDEARELASERLEAAMRKERS